MSRIWFVAEIDSRSAGALADLLRRAMLRARDQADRLEQGGFALKSQTAADRRAERGLELCTLARDCERLALALDRAHRELNTP